MGTGCRLHPITQRATADRADLMLPSNRLARRKRSVERFARFQQLSAFGNHAIELTLPHEVVPVLRAATTRAAGCEEASVSLGK